MHYWLDPANAEILVAAIARTLIAADPDNRATYEVNAEIDHRAAARAVR